MTSVNPAYERIIERHTSPVSAVCLVPSPRVRHTRNTAKRFVAIDRAKQGHLMDPIKRVGVE